jgi:hypothetical protein
MQSANYVTNTFYSITISHELLRIFVQKSKLAQKIIKLKTNTVIIIDNLLFFNQRTNFLTSL